MEKKKDFIGEVHRCQLKEFAKIQEREDKPPHFSYDVDLSAKFFD